MALGNAVYQGRAVQKASEYIRKHVSMKTDPYTLAVLANFVVDSTQDRGFTEEVMQLATEVGSTDWQEAVGTRTPSLHRVNSKTDSAPSCSQMHTATPEGKT